MVLNRRVNKGLILAAGDGGRLGSLTTTCPKALLTVNDKTLISYPIEVLAVAGISEIAIVVGYLGDKVIEVLGNGSNFGVRLQYIFNPIISVAMLFQCIRPEIGLKENRLFFA